MQIEEALDLKIEVERIVSSILQTFHNQTGIRIFNIGVNVIDVTTVKDLSEGKRHELYTIELEIEL